MTFLGVMISKLKGWLRRPIRLLEPIRGGLK
jgi:hypothetical protein